MTSPDASAVPAAQFMPRTDAPTPDLAVATRGLTKSYGKRVALTGLDMSVPTGRVYGFLGPNGSGKTTALRLLTGLLRPNTGTINLFGTPYTWHDRTRLFKVGSLIETPSFYPYLSGAENLQVLAASGPPTDLGRIDQVLAYVGMSGDWGSGRLLTGRLFSVLLTDDGRVVAGAVAPETLYEAARG